MEEKRELPENDFRQFFFPPFFQNPLDASGKRSIITSKVNNSKMK